MFARGVYKSLRRRLVSSFLSLVNQGSPLSVPIPSQPLPSPLSVSIPSQPLPSPPPHIGRPWGQRTPETGRQWGGIIPLLSIPLKRPIQGVLSLASSALGCLLYTRQWMLTIGLIRHERLPVPVISVGNLTWGGTGKTPMVEFITSLLQESGLRPLILTRGYAGGDEARMLQSHLSSPVPQEGQGHKAGAPGAASDVTAGVLAGEGKRRGALSGSTAGVLVGVGKKRGEVAKGILETQGIQPAGLELKKQLEECAREDKTMNTFGLSLKQRLETEGESGPLGMSSDVVRSEQSSVLNKQSLEESDKGCSQEEMRKHQQWRKREDGIGAAVQVDGVGAAVRDDGVGVIVLDDGMQHITLARDVEIVMVNSLNPFGNGHLIPRGILREPTSALARADVIVVHNADLVSQLKLHSLLQRIRSATTKAGEGIPPIALWEGTEAECPLGHPHWEGTEAEGVIPIALSASVPTGFGTLRTESSAPPISSGDQPNADLREMEKRQHKEGPCISGNPRKEGASSIGRNQQTHQSSAPLGIVEGVPVVCLSGVGCPEAFEATVTQKLKAQVVHHVVLPDHWSLEEEDVAGLRTIWKETKLSGGQEPKHLVITEKDYFRNKAFVEDALEEFNPLVLQCSLKLLPASMLQPCCLKWLLCRSSG